MKIRSIKTTPRFEKSFEHLPKRVQIKATVRKEIFAQGPFSPKLKTHKLTGKLNNIWSFSVDYSYRIIFEFIADDKVIFYDIGTHGIYK